MDITRNWRLKTHRNQLLATRDPQTGAVTLPQQTASTVRDQAQRRSAPSVVAPQAEIDLAEAAR